MDNVENGTYQIRPWFLLVNECSYISRFKLWKFQVCGEGCEVLSWRMLNHQSFYFYTEYKLVSSGFIPSFSLPYISVLNHIQTTILQFWIGTMSHTSPSLNFSVCVCDIFVLLASFKVQICSQSFWKPICCNSLWGGLFLESWLQWINLCLLVFYVRLIVVPQCLHRFELSCIL